MFVCDFADRAQPGCQVCIDWPDLKIFGWSLPPLPPGRYKTSVCVFPAHPPQCADHGVFCLAAHQASTGPSWESQSRELSRSGPL